MIVKFRLYGQNSGYQWILIYTSNAMQHNNLAFRFTSENISCNFIRRRRCAVDEHYRTSNNTWFSTELLQTFGTVNEHLFESSNSD